ncbi:MAG TPA: DUF4157 domain-containing protein [Blastocatellia bacterium]|nr:DUF4157 domain-containing protein [Blastocatellia bacterium]
MQRKESGGADATVTAPPIVHETLSSAGQPLDPTTRAYFELRFGNDFSQVRIHTDSRAVESAHAVEALAYTIGNDIVLGAGQYRPGTTAGNNLLAHELTHVVQQAQAPLLARQVQRQTSAEAASDHGSDMPEDRAIGDQGLSQLDREHPEFSRQLADFSRRFWDLYELTQGPLILSGLIDATYHIQALSDYKYYLDMLRRQEQYMNQGDRYSPRNIHNWLEFAGGALGAVGPLMDLAAPGVSDDLQETESIREIRRMLPELDAELTGLQGASFIRAESEKIEAQKQAGRDEAVAEAARRETPEGRRDAAIDFTREYVKDEHKWWPNQNHSAAEIFAEQLGYYYIYEEQLSGADIRMALNALEAEDHDLLDRALFQGLLLEYLLLEGVTDLGVAELPRASGGGFYNGFNLTWLELLQRDPITTPGFSSPTPADIAQYELGLHWGALVGIGQGLYGAAMDLISWFQVKTYTDMYDLLVNNVWDEKWRFEQGQAFATALHTYIQDIADDGAFEIGQKFGQFIGMALVEILLGIISGAITKVVTKLLGLTRWGAALVKAAERVADAMPWVEPKVVDDDLIPDELPRAAALQGQREPATPSQNAPRNPEPHDSAPENLDPAGNSSGSIPLSDAELEASVAISSRKPNDVITPPEIANEVAYVDQHPELVEGGPTNRKAKIGDKSDHKIAKTASGCERQSEKPIKLPRCPIILEEQTKKPPAGEDAAAEPAEINEMDLAVGETAEGIGGDLTETLDAASNAPEDAATGAPDQSTASGQQANTPTSNAIVSAPAPTQSVTSYMRVQEEIRTLRDRLKEMENRLIDLNNLITREYLARRTNGTVFPAQVGSDSFEDLDEVIEEFNSLVDSNKRRGPETEMVVKHGRREGKKAEKIESGEITDLKAKIKDLESKRDKVPDNVKDRLRDKSPGKTLREKFRIDSGGEDKVFGGQAPTGISPDHIVPFSEIIKMDGFSVLDEEQMVEVLNWEENLIAMDSDKNSTRGHKRWQEWQFDAYSLFDASVSHQDRLKKIAEMIAKENDLRPKIQKMIHDLVNEKLGK